MKKRFAIVLLPFFLNIITPTYAIEPIKILLARTVTVSDGDARQMLNQLNETMEQSALGSHDFQSASFLNGLAEVHVVSCSGTDGPAVGPDNPCRLILLQVSL